MSSGAAFFIEIERFDRNAKNVIRKVQEIDYVSICSPNYLHDSYIRFVLRINTPAICEKMLVLNLLNIDELTEIESNKHCCRVWNLPQLLLHPDIVAFKKHVATEIAADPKRRYDIDLAYIASRGRRYQISWKGNTEKSGVIATNIGILFHVIAVD